MEYIIVQAGGKGSRLGYLTKNKPKALVPVENKPMMFHLFDQYPEARFIIIADYKKEVLREYLERFAHIKYQIVYAEGSGTCSGLQQAIQLLPENQPFMLIWSDLVLCDSQEMPKEYISHDKGVQLPDYIGISKTFSCRWQYHDGKFTKEPSSEHGVAGCFLFGNKKVLDDVPQSGELVQWMQDQKLIFKEFSMAGTREYGLLEAYERLTEVKCRSFNSITIEADILTKQGITEQGRKLAVRERNWYSEVQKYDVHFLPHIYELTPLKMEYIKGSNIYDLQLSYTGRYKVLEQLITALKKLHEIGKIQTDTFSMHEVYFKKTMNRLEGLQDLIPFARDRYIRINGRNCRNVYYYTRKLEEKLSKISCKQFSFIHGDCTFSNLMLRNDGTPVLLDPRGYFGFQELYGDENYDWAKLYYSLVGNYDKFNLSKFHLSIDEDEVRLEVSSNHWEDLEQEFFNLTGADEETIKLLHACIWLSFTTYAWQNYDSICGAFYNGLYYLEEVL